MPEKVFFTSGALPAHLSDAQKAGIWYDLLCQGGYGVDYRIDKQNPFWATYSGTIVGRILVERAGGTSTLGQRTRKHIAMDKSENFRLFINRDGHATEFNRPQAELRPGKGAAFLTATGDPGALHLTSGSHLDFVTLPAGLLIERLPRYGPALLRSIAPDNEALIMLGHYCRVLDTMGALQSPELTAHVETTIVDLIVLAAGVHGDEMELANGRGLRSARLSSILEGIRAGFADPHFSTQSLARDLRLSQRYVNELLAETGSGFAERVLELRLEKATAALADRNHDHVRISEIAYACGFNDISYFNRQFRRRFGHAPGDLRRD